MDRYSLNYVIGCLEFKFIFRYLIFKYFWVFVFFSENLRRYIGIVIAEGW